MVGFSLPGMAIYLLDAHSLIYQVFHAVPAMHAPDGQPTNAVFGFVGDILRLRQRQPEAVVAVFDPPGKTFRDELFVEYKAQRAPMPDDLVRQLPVIHEALAALRIPVIQVPGFEADDALATLARHAEHAGREVFVCTSDKDMRQLISDQIKLLNLRKDLVLDAAALLADWGIRPNQVVDLLTLTGDSVDNVPGVPGVGIKTAAKLLNEYGTLDAVLAAAPAMKKGKLRDNLLASAAVVARSKPLVQLVDNVPMNIDWDQLRYRDWDAPRFLRLCERLGFRRYAAEARELAKAQERAQAASKEPGLFDHLPDEPVPSVLGASSTSGLAFNAHLVDTPARFVEFMQQFRQQRRFAIDLETTGLDPLTAEIVGYAICWQPGESFYLAVRGPAGARLLDPDDVARKLKPILENPAIQKVNQNIKFDLMVLWRAGIQMQGIAGDSMIASYLLQAGERNHNLDDLSLQFLNHRPIPITDLIGTGKGQKRMDEVDPAQVAAYAGEDADLAYRLCDVLEPQIDQHRLGPLYRDLEIPLIEVLARMEHTGVALDVPLLKGLSAEFAAELAVLEKEIFTLAGRTFNVDSPKQLRQVLFDELKLPTQRKTAVSGEASTGQDVLEDLAAAGHELPRKIIDYRQLAKLKGTYVDALPAMVSPVTGRLHGSFNQTIAATGRLSSSNPNLQNIPMRTERGQQIRRAFVAGDARLTLLAADYSQIELRVLAHLSDDTELLKAFQEDRDIHAYVASQIFNVEESEVSSAQRRMAKTVNFGVIYGLSAFGLAKRLAISKEEATAFIDAYFARYPGVTAFQERTLAQARQDGYVYTILGRRRRAVGIREQSTYRQRNQAERESLNAVIQGSAADLMKRAMLNLDRRIRRDGLPARLLLQIHDELVLDVEQIHLAEVAAIVVHEMEHALELKVPLRVDAAAGPNWLDGKSIDGAAGRGA